MAENTIESGTADIGVIQENTDIAAKLRDYADLLAQQGADGFRERAYRKAAEAIVGLEEPLSAIFRREGEKGLIALPRIGTGIAGAIAELITTRRWSQLDRLRGELSPERVFLTIPGIGHRLAHRLAEDHQLESLEDLEAALLDSSVPVQGFGERRRAAVLAVLAQRLGRPAIAPSKSKIPVPDVELVLQVDSMYRKRAAAGLLRTIAPKRHNPEHKSWLPIMHARHDAWHFTALYSNTLLANELGKTHDWVVIYYELEGYSEGRCTVVTESRGFMAGERVVRGREDECTALASTT